MLQGNRTLSSNAKPVQEEAHQVSHKHEEATAAAGKAGASAAPASKAGAVSYILYPPRTELIERKSVYLEKMAFINPFGAARL